MTGKQKTITANTLSMHFQGKREIEIYPGSLKKGEDCKIINATTSATNLQRTNTKSKFYWKTVVIFPSNLQP